MLPRQSCEMNRWCTVLACIVLCEWAQCLSGFGADVVSVGEALPVCTLIDQDGRPCDLQQFKGQALAITFIFTRCPMAAYCPRMTDQFLAAQGELAKNYASGKWHLLSLSIDPQHDTPAQLSEYAKAHHADFSRWTFATGKVGVVTDLGRVFGLKVSNEEGLINHNLRTVVVDPGGHVQRIFKGNEWTAKELVWELTKVMPAKP